MHEIEKFHSAKNTFFTMDREQKKTFNGLYYFPEAPELRFQVTVERFSGQQEITIQTSTGDTRTYQRYGQFHFPVNGMEEAIEERTTNKR